MVFNFTLNAHTDQERDVIELNAIYAASLSLCWWPLQNSSNITVEAIKNTLCWNNWYYRDNNCLLSVTSGVAYFDMLSYDNEVYPGAPLT